MNAPAHDGVAVHLVSPLPGAGCERDFVLEPFDPDGLLLTLRSERTPSLRFVLTSAERLFAGYHPVVATSVVTALHADGIDDVDVLVVLNVATTVTANLRAPVCLSRTSGRARQVLLDDETLSMRHPLAAP